VAKESNGNLLFTLGRERFWELAFSQVSTPTTERLKSTCSKGGANLGHRADTISSRAAKVNEETTSGYPTPPTENLGAGVLARAREATTPKIP